MDPIALWGLVAGVVGAVAAVVGAVAATYAAKYAKASPTKEDLERVEANTAETAKRINAVRDHLAEQNAREASLAEAQMVNMDVNGRGLIGGELKLQFRLMSPTVTLLHIELINGLGMLSGVASCEEVDERIFAAVVDPAAATRWFNTGDDRGRVDLKLVRIRAFFKAQGQENKREFSAEMQKVADPNNMTPSVAAKYWNVSGAC